MFCGFDCCRTRSQDVSNQILQNLGTGIFTYSHYTALGLLLDTVSSFPWGWFLLFIQLYMALILSRAQSLDLHVCTEQFHCFKTCRCFTLAFGWIIFLSLFIPVNALLKGQDRLRKKIEVGWILSFVLYNFVFTMLFRYSSI